MRRKQDRTKYKTPFYVEQNDGSDLLFFGNKTSRRQTDTGLGSFQHQSDRITIETDFDYDFQEHDLIKDYQKNVLSIEDINSKEEQSAKSRRPKIIWRIDIT